MTNDKNLIFEKYLEILNEGIKSQAGVGGTTGPVSQEELGKRATRTKKFRLAIDKKNGKYFSVPELMAEYSGISPEKIKSLIIKYMGDKKSQLNPMEAGWLLDKPFTIPLVNLPNRILGIRGLKHGEQAGPYLKFLNIADKALSGLYKQETGKDPNDIRDNEKLLSFMSRKVQRSGEEEARAERARVGGTSRDDRERGGMYTHITNPREDSPRFSQYKDKSFGFDVREKDKPEISEPERQQDVEDRINKQVQKYAWELMKKGVTGEDFKKAVQKYRADLAGRKEPNAITVSEPPQTPSTPEPEKKPKKPATKKPATKKKKVNKESYFIKLLPF